MKNYILDTNVLLHDPNSLLNFQDNHVLIPIEVVEEIDRFKRDTSELGQNARSVSRMLDSLRGTGRLSEGVTLQNGGHLRFRHEYAGQRHYLSEHQHRSSHCGQSRLYHHRAARFGLSPIDG